MIKEEWIDLMYRLDKSKIMLLKDSYDRSDCINIRHDIDNDLHKAVKMASEEAKLGIKSTYFFLNTAFYWQFKQEVKAAIMIIKGFGHEIGWHNDAISEHLNTMKPLKSCICEPLDFLRTYAEVTGSASHGGPLCYKHKFLNYYIFKESKPNPKFPIMYQRFNMSEFGLKYEAYHTGFTHYVSESGNEWKQDNDSILTDFKKNGGKLHILLHPQHWNL